MLDYVRVVVDEKTGKWIYLHQIAVVEPSGTGSRIWFGEKSIDSKHRPDALGALFDKAVKDASATLPPPPRGDQLLRSTDKGYPDVPEPPVGAEAATHWTIPACCLAEFYQVRASGQSITRWCRSGQYWHDTVVDIASLTPYLPIASTDPIVELPPARPEGVEATHWSVAPSGSICYFCFGIGASLIWSRERWEKTKIKVGDTTAYYVPVRPEGAFKASHWIQDREGVFCFFCFSARDSMRWDTGNRRWENCVALPTGSVPYGDEG